MEIYYVTFKVLLFKCKWIDSNINVEIGELGFRQVDLGKATYMNEPFTMASQEKKFLISIILLTQDVLFLYNENIF